MPEHALHRFRLPHLDDKQWLLAAAVARFCSAAISANLHLLGGGPAHLAWGGVALGSAFILVGMWRTKVNVSPVIRRLAQFIVAIDSLSLVLHVFGL